MRFLDGYPPTRTSVRELIARALIEAMNIAARPRGVALTHGGSAPFSVLGAALGRPMIFGGLGPGGPQHAPAEYATVAGMRLHDRSVIEFLYRFAALPARSS